MTMLPTGEDHAPREGEHERTGQHPGGLPAGRHLQGSIRWRATLFGWTACFAQASEFSTFAFYLPVLFVMVGVSSILGTNLVTMALHIIAAIAGWIGPLLTPKIGHRGISISRFAIVLVSLLVAAAAL